MPHFERGVYEPNDDARVFDGAEDDEDVEGSRLPLLIVLALLVLAMFAGVVWLAYSQGVARGRTETPVLTAQNGPARIAPQNPGGVEQPYKGFKIYEQPAPPDEDSDTAQPAQAAQPAPAQPAPAQMAAAQPAAPVETPKAAAPPPAKPVPVAAKPAPVPAPVKVEKKDVAPPRPDPIKAEIAKTEPVKVEPVKTEPAKPVTLGPATGAPRSLTPAAAATPKPVAAAPVAAAPAGGAYVLQIGAYKSQSDAETAWKAYKAKHAALLAGANSDIQQADLGEKGTWYRLRIAGFSNKDVASALCDRLKADGGGCFLGK